MARTKTSDLRAEIAALREEISQLRRVGQQLSNVAYNMHQPSTYKDGIDEHTKLGLQRLYKDWDAIKRTPVLNPPPSRRPVRLVTCIHTEDSSC